MATIGDSVQVIKDNCDFEDRASGFIGDRRLSRDIVRNWESCVSTLANERVIFFQKTVTVTTGSSVVKPSRLTSIFRVDVFSVSDITSDRRFITKVFPSEKRPGLYDSSSVIVSSYPRFYYFNNETGFIEFDRNISGHEVDITFFALPEKPVVTEDPDTGEKYYELDLELPFPEGYHDIYEEKVIAAIEYQIGGSDVGRAADSKYKTRMQDCIDKNRVYVREVIPNAGRYVPGGSYITVL